MSVSIFFKFLCKFCFVCILDLVLIEDFDVIFYWKILIHFWTIKFSFSKELRKNRLLVNFPCVFKLYYESLDFQELRSACVPCVYVLPFSACVSVPRIGQKVTNHSWAARRQPMTVRVVKIAGKRQLHCLGIPHDSDFILQILGYCGFCRSWYYSF